MGSFLSHLSFKILRFYHRRFYISYLQFQILFIQFLYFSLRFFNEMNLVILGAFLMIYFEFGFQFLTVSIFDFLNHHDFILVLIIYFV